MPFLINPAEKAAYDSLNSSRRVTVPTWQHGETRPITVGLVDPIDAPIGARVWEPRDLSGWTFRAAVGRGFQQPIAGTFTITFGANTTTALPYNATAGQISTALNLLASVIAESGVTVVGENGFFTFQFGNTDDQALMTGDADGLFPLSILDFGEGIEGATGVNEVQVLRIAQNPGAYVALTVASDAPDAVVDPVQTGGGGLNAKYRITLSPIPYDGKFTVIIDGEESGLIDYAASSADFQAALEAMDAVEVGNVSATRESVGTYFFAFQGAHAGEDMGTITVDASALKVIQTLTGDLSLSNAVIDALLGSESSVDVIFEIEGTPPAGAVQKLFRDEGRLIGTIIGPANVSPPPTGSWYTQSESDARYLNKNAPGSTLPTGFTLAFASGSALTMASGSTLTVNGGFVASTLSLNAPTDATEKPDEDIALNGLLLRQKWAMDNEFSIIASSNSFDSTATGTAASALKNYGSCRVLSGTDNNGTASVFLQNGVGHLFNIEGGRFTYVDFSKPMWLTFIFTAGVNEIGSGNNTTISANGFIRATIGKTSGAGALGQKGFGFLLTKNSNTLADVKILTYDSSLHTSASIGTINFESLVAAKSTRHEITFYLDGAGALYVFLDGVYNSMIATGPTGESASGVYVVFEANTGSDTTSNEAILCEVRGAVKKN